MIYYLFYAPDIYTCSLSLTKLKFHFILSCRKMCWLEGGMMILPGVSNDYILSFLSPLRKSGTIKFLSTSRTSTILSFSSDYNFASKRQLRNISETHVTGIWYSDLVFLKQQHIQALKGKKKKKGNFLLLNICGSWKQSQQKLLGKYQLCLAGYFQRHSNMTSAETWGIIFTLVYCSGKWNRLDFQGKRTVHSNSWFVTAITN